MAMAGLLGIVTAGAAMLLAVRLRQAEPQHVIAGFFGWCIGALP